MSGPKFDVRTKIIFYEKSKQPSIYFTEDYFRVSATLFSTTRLLEDVKNKAVGESLESKTVLENGDWMLLFSLGSLADGKYKITVTPKENKDLIEGTAEATVTKYSIED